MLIGFRVRYVSHTVFDTVDIVAVHCSHSHYDHLSFWFWYYVGMKKCWRWDASGLFSSFEAHDFDDDEMKAPCLSPTRAMSYNGADDKASVPVGRKVPISASARQSTRVLMEPGQKPKASDHDFLSERGVASVIHRMNISNNPGDSLYSGGPDGHGRGYVSTHNATLDPSTGMKHIAHFYQYLLHVAREQSAVEDIDELKKELPYVVLFETDGGPDHNLTFLKNQLALFGLFLAGNMDKLSATRCCSGYSFLNVCERLMSLLTIGMSGLSLMMDPNADSFLMEDVIGNVSSMKGVRESIAEYDDAVAKVLGILERRLERVAAANNDVPPSNENDGDAVSYDYDSSFVYDQSLFILQNTFCLSCSLYITGGKSTRGRQWHWPSSYCQSWR